MKYTLFSRLIAVVVLSSVGVASASHARQPLKVASVQTTIHQDSNSQLQVPQTLAQTSNTVKVGEYQSETNEQNAITKIQSHTWNQRPAATLYVRNIPILTFVDSADAASQSAPANGGVKVASETVSNSDPVWRATTVAAQLNQLYQAAVDADAIKVRWDGNRKQYIIQANNQELVALDKNTILPDTTKNLAQDALQATNRLRRQLGNAAPLKQVEGQPRPVQRVVRNPVRALAQGLASWYGPGFHGARTANGERFNQHAMTAAHRTLPFGTQVRVTNVNNGRSVVVRINDRGPFTGGRVIDLSMAAAQTIGMVSSGVAPVQIEVLNAVR